MMKLAFLAVVLTANVAQAADFCALSADQVKAVPQTLAGNWQGTFRDGVDMHNGKARAMPQDKSVPQVVLAADGDTVKLTAGGFFPDLSFAAAAAVQDFALKDEAPLGAAKFLSTEVTETGVTCDPGTLPQFLGKTPPGGAMAVTFRIIALTPDQFVLVILGEGGGDAGRAVFDLHRAP